MENPVATIRSYVEAFNRGDTAGMASCFASPGFILDGTPPHVWQGPSAALDWFRDILIEGEHLGASQYAVTLGEPIHQDIGAGSAYVVLPASMTFLLKGQPMQQTGARFTVALRMLADGWRIAAWAWTKGA